MATIGHSGGMTAAVGTWIRRFRGDLQKEAARRQVFNTTYAELSAMSDRDLADIGIIRTEIADVAREAASQV